MNVCLYGSSSSRIGDDYVLPVEELGEALAKAGHTLVYGAGGAGLMGAAARGATRGGGRIIGVVPGFLQVDGVIYDHCDELVVTDNMRDRKQGMEERAEAFIVTPGGIGTFEEFFEIYTLKQLGRHTKPIVVYNLNGYYDDMLTMLAGMTEKNFMKARSLALFTVANTAEEVLEQLAAPAAPVNINETKFV